MPLGLRGEPVQRVRILAYLKGNVQLADLHVLDLRIGRQRDVDVVADPAHLQHDVGGRLER